MNEITKVLQECHAIVWTARKELEPFWPTPATEDALLFAFCELGESIDAYLRTKPEYARNNAKDLSVLDELADTALMLLTAVGPDVAWLPNEGQQDKDAHEWTQYTQEMMYVMKCYQEDRRTRHPFVDWSWFARLLVERIATHPGMDLPQRLIARLERIKAKRMVAA